MGRVLIVDDNEDNLLLFQEYLEDNGYNINTFPSNLPAAQR